MADFRERASLVTDGDFPSRTPEEPRLLDGRQRQTNGFYQRGPGIEPGTPPPWL